MNKLIECLPQMRTIQDLEELEQLGYNVRSGFGGLNPARLNSQRTALECVNRTLVREAQHVDYDVTTDIEPGKFQAACVACARLALKLILEPPTGIEVCSRNPKLEFPQLTRLLLHAALTEQPVPFVVPSCPDTNQYTLGDGLGEVIPKGLEYSRHMRDMLVVHGFDAQFDVQVADVEGVDPIILASSGETTQSHFVKTAETIRKAQQVVRRDGSADYITVRSMHGVFVQKGLDYGQMQSSAMGRIAGANDKKTRKTIDGLLAERVRLGNFDHLPTDSRYEHVVAELAGYAAYGAMIAGDAVILSPDAKSAIPAYHYAVDLPEQYSPVLYAR